MLDDEISITLYAHCRVDAVSR